MVDYVNAVLESWSRVRPQTDVSPVAVTLRVQRASAIVQARLDEVAADEMLISHKGDLDTLTALWRAESSLTAGELAAAAQLTSGGMTNRLDRLEDAGLVERHPDPDDRRAVRISLTGAGRRVVGRAFDRNLAAQRELLAPLTASEQARLARLLQKLLHGLGDDPPGA